MKYWKRVDSLGKTITVESYGYDLPVEGAVEIDKAEFDAYIASLPVHIPEPVRDLAAEIDELKAIVKDHEARLKKDIEGHTR